MAEERDSTGYAVDQDDNQSGFEPPQSPKHHKKDTKRYVAFRSDDDESSEFEVEETPRKDRKKPKKDRSNTFKEKFKSIKVKKRDKENKEKTKEKEKEEKKEKKEKKKHKRSLSAGAALTPANVQSPPPPVKPVFGVKLEVAVARSKIADGLEMPTIFRQCIHYLEENGLDQEGLYRVSGVKSKIDELKTLFDHGTKIDFDAEDLDPNIVAGLLKQYLRELPENLLTQTLQPVFDAIVGLRDEREQVEKMKYLLGELPRPNYTLLSWLFVHLDHVMKNSAQTKMSIQSISIVFSPTMNISHGVLYIILTNVDTIFPNVKIIKYVEPAEKEPQLIQPKSPRSLAEELAKQEVFLDNLYEKMKQEGTNEEEVMEKMWEVQRTVTQLKRKLKTIRRSELGRSATEDSSTVNTHPESKMEEPETEKSEVLVTRSRIEAEPEAKTVKKEMARIPDENQSQESRKKRLFEIAKQPDEEIESSRRQRRNEEHSRILDKCKDVKTAKEEVVSVTEQKTEAEDGKKEGSVDGHEVTAPVEPAFNEDFDDDEDEDEDEIAELLQEELRLKIEQEELLALSARLKDRIQRELNDVDRLRMEVDEFKRKEDRASPVSSSDDDSSGDDSDSESGTDSDSDNSELENILKELQKENEKLENQTVDLVKALVEENDKCVQLKVELRLIEECKG
ncbi:ralA-binding protein 1-like isoform X2 [Rhopilema esculentum]|uniref:ralA-binding protein 1-like isoform X2 n=1 Tax=Rhopilema esculentum TaxID=499914 RepID=UPI0031DBF270